MFYWVDLQARPQSSIGEGEESRIHSLPLPSHLHPHRPIPTRRMRMKKTGMMTMTKMDEAIMVVMMVKKKNKYKNLDGRIRHSLWRWPGRRWGRLGDWSSRWGYSLRRWKSQRWWRYRGCPTEQTCLRHHRLWRHYNWLERRLLTTYSLLGACVCLFSRSAVSEQTCFC